MHEIAVNLINTFTQVCPTFLSVPHPVPYPHMTVEPKSELKGMPRGPTVAIITLKIWSRYAGLREILLLKKEAESKMEAYPLGSIKLMDSILSLGEDKITHVHTFRLKVRSLSHE